MHVRLFYSPNGVRFISIWGWQLELFTIKDKIKLSFSVFNDLTTLSESRAVTRTRMSRNSSVTEEGRELQRVSRGG